MADDFKTVRETAAESMIGALVTAVVRRAAAAGRESAAAGLVITWLSPIGGWNTQDRVRYGALAIAVAGYVNFVLLLLISGYSAPGIPKSAIAIAATMAALVAWAPGPFVTAWATSLPGRLVAWLARSIQRPAE